MELSAPDSNVIDYITIATVGNATDFGDLTIARYKNAIVSINNYEEFLEEDMIRIQDLNNIIDYITIASTGNATDFGDLTVTRNHGGCNKF